LQEEKQVQGQGDGEDTLPDSYFVSDPLGKMQLVRYYVTDVNGAAVPTVRTGDDVAVIAVFKNVQ
jgi:hypothetical protein